MTTRTKRGVERPIGRQWSSRRKGYARHRARPSERRGTSRRGIQIKLVIARYAVAVVVLAVTDLWVRRVAAVDISILIVTIAPHGDVAGWLATALGRFFGAAISVGIGVGRSTEAVGDLPGEQSSPLLRIDHSGLPFATTGDQ